MTEVPENTTRPRRKRPAITAAEQEREMIELATACAREQLKNGTASSQVIVHYLKLGTTREALEKEKLRHENLLLESKKKEIDNRADYTRIAQEAVDAFRRYSGYSDDEDI